jgi:hypothetical protein
VVRLVRLVPMVHLVHLVPLVAGLLIAGLPTLMVMLMVLLLICPAHLTPLQSQSQSPLGTMRCLPTAS